LKEKFSRDLSDSFNKKIRLHVNFLRKLPCLFFFHLGKFWSVSRKIRHACVLTFLKSFFCCEFLQGLKTTTYTKKDTIGLGKRICGEKEHSQKICKK